MSEKSNYSLSVPDENYENDKQSVLDDVTFGFVEAEVSSKGVFAPRLISNENGSYMGKAIEMEIRQSEAFDMSVAFVSEGALKRFYQDFLDHSEANYSKKSRFITSTKNFFNSPDVFKELLKIQKNANIEVFVWSGNKAKSSFISSEDFHPKGYVFKHRLNNGQLYSNVYIGSSNFTLPALSKQKEWNLRVSSLERGDLISQVKREIDSQLNNATPLTEEWLRQYEEDFRKYVPERKIILEQRKTGEIVPNAMQEEALTNLAKLRSQGEHRAIIISATGTGKTFLSAFDVRAVKPKRMLYIAQQQQILKAAKESYQRVLGCVDDEIGLFAGDSKEYDRKYVFATIQTLSLPENLRKFKADEFDYILVDEVHHAGAQSYKNVIEHFSRTNFTLGMTATPERTDGINIFELFGHNIAYEIRLQKALDAGMLCPFHYYGVAEYQGTAVDSDEEIPHIHVVNTMSSEDRGQLETEIAQLASKSRVRYIIDILQKYGSYHTPVTGLVFCSRREEAEMLSMLFNEQFNQQAENRNYRTVAVTGNSSQKERNDAVRKLELGELDYIFTVDLFNEGIDIPALNQIVMLRNTQSSIVFTQQLGRGLRKFEGKESVTVIDFIGNYTNNYLIPVALYGNTGDRDRTRRNLQQRSIGLSSISFDPIAKERIIESLDSTDWSEMRKLAEEYRRLRFELGRIPMLIDVYAHDPSLTYTLAAKQGNYLRFVKSREQSLCVSSQQSEGLAIGASTIISEAEDAILKFATEILLPGLRPHELIILEHLCNLRESTFKDLRYPDELSNQTLSQKELRSILREEFSTAYLDETQFVSALRVLDFSFFTRADSRRFGNIPLVAVSQNNEVALSEEFKHILSENMTFRRFFADTLHTGLLNCHDQFRDAVEQGRSIDHGFIYEQKYRRLDVMRILGWAKAMNDQIVGGYARDIETGTMPIFVKYETSQYEDCFLNEQTMHYFSKHGRTPNSPEFRWLRENKGRKLWKQSHFIPLFVMRKEETRESTYYYVGHVTDFSKPLLASKPDPSRGVTINVTVTDLHLDKPVDPELYRHITGEYAL